MIRLTALSADEARQVVVSSQFAPRASSSTDVLKGARVIQLDPLTRVEKSHKLTCLLRLHAGFDAAQIDHELWATGTATSFETYTHAACLFPIEDWPLLRLARKRAAERHDAPPAEALQAVLDVVAATDSGATLREIEMAGTKSTGWGWSEGKRAAEHLVWRGELICSTRRSNRRVYDLPQRRVSPTILEAIVDDDEILATLARNALRSLGVVTVADVASHYHLAAAEAERGLIMSGAEEVTVDGWQDRAWIDPSPAAGALASADGPRFVGPFDNLLRDRSRAKRVFKFDYTFEAYKPARLRLYGHYVLALLVGDELVGRVDAQRVDGALVVRQAFAEPSQPLPEFADDVAAAASTLARQLGLELQEST